ncbi:MAG: hypothetical protein GY820_38145 [Gammaproteobacteria bacterium]|nr:hypothetical protein [Gammaproteobacteria bacterium]
MCSEQPPTPTQTPKLTPMPSRRRRRRPAEVEQHRVLAPSRPAEVEQPRLLAIVFEQPRVLTFGEVEQPRVLAFCARAAPSAPFILLHLLCFRREQAPLEWPYLVDG